MGFFMYSIRPSADKDSIAPSFLIWMPFISSSCLIARARTSSTMLNKRGERRLPYLVPNLKENPCTFCPLSMMLAVGFSYMAFIMLCMFIPTLLRVSVTSGCWILSNIFCTSIDVIIFMLHFVYVVNHIY